MKRVLKYTVNNQDEKLSIPAGSTVLSAKTQGQTLVIYAIVNLGNVETGNTVIENTTVVDIVVRNTGDLLPDNIDEYIFLDSVYFRGTEVWQHVFYKVG